MPRKDLPPLGRKVGIQNTPNKLTNMGLSPKVMVIILYILKDKQKIIFKSLQINRTYVDEEWKKKHVHIRVDAEFDPRVGGGGLFLA